MLKLMNKNVSNKTQELRDCFVVSIFNTAQHDSHFYTLMLEK